MTALDLDSTLIRRGTQAATLSEMAEFVTTIEQRPLGRLLEDLPGLAALSETKFHLARKVIRRRLRGLADIEREQLGILAEEVAATVDALTADRIRGLFV